MSDSPLPRTLVAAAALVLAATLGVGADRGEARRDQGDTDRPAPKQQPERLGEAERKSLLLDVVLDVENPYGDAGAVRAAIARGLDFLAARQAEEVDGSFPPTGAMKTAPVAIAALASLAFMSAGSGLDRGPHGGELSRAIDYLLNLVDREPTSRQRGYISENRDVTSQTHGHGFAALALAEAFAVSPNSSRGARLAEAVELAVRCIENSQGFEGGWYYEPTRGLQHEGSVTICLIQALRAAKGAGIRVDPAVIAKAVDYVERSQKEDGSFRYALGMDRTSVALTAAAISTLNATGQYHGSRIAQGYDYIQRELRARENAPDTKDLLRIDEGVRFPYYERLYLAQAFWQNADRSVFDSWARLERRAVLRAQRRDGSWKGKIFGDCYATAMNILFLALPDRLLPIFQR